MSLILDVGCHNVLLSALSTTLVNSVDIVSNLDASSLCRALSSQFCLIYSPSKFNKITVITVTKKGQMFDIKGEHFVSFIVAIHSFTLVASKK